MSTNFFQLGCPADIGLFIEARHQFDHNGDFLAILRGADQGLHQHRVSAGAVNRHFDRNHLRILDCLIQQFNDRGKGLVGVMQQDVAFADAFENVAAFADGLGDAGDKG